MLTLLFSQADLLSVLGYPSTTCDAVIQRVPKSVDGRNSAETATTTLTQTSNIPRWPSNPCALS